MPARLREAPAARRTGDTLTVTKLDRVARSIADARDTNTFTARGVELNLGGSVHDPADPVGRLLSNVLAMVAGFGGDLIRARTRKGMAVAKAKGRLRGKQPKLNPRQEAPLVGGCIGPAATRVLSAVDAGATLEQVADVPGRSTATVALRLQRAARDSRSSALPAGVLTISQITSARNWSVTTVHVLRDTARLPMYRHDGLWVARQQNVEAIAAHPQRRSLAAGHALGNTAVRRPEPPRRPVTAAEITALRAATAHVHRAVPACHRHAPPPWPVHLLCHDDLGHEGHHTSRLRGSTATWA